MCIPNTLYLYLVSTIYITSHSWYTYDQYEQRHCQFIAIYDRISILRIQDVSLDCQNARNYVVEQVYVLFFRLLSLFLIFCFFFHSSTRPGCFLSRKIAHAHIIYNWIAQVFAVYSIYPMIDFLLLFSLRVVVVVIYLMWHFIIHTYVGCDMLFKCTYTISEKNK